MSFKFGIFMPNITYLALEISVYRHVPGCDVSHVKEQGLMAI